MPSRLRSKDETVDQGIITYSQLAKATCAATAVWTPYYVSPSNVWRNGKRRYMQDVTGNAPQRQKGVAGYTYNPMSSVQVEIQPGTGGQSWEIQVITPDCSGVDLYNRRFRLQSTGLTLGRRAAGFNYPPTLAGWPAIEPLIDHRLRARVLGLAASSIGSKRGRGGSNSNLFESLAEADKSLRLLSDYLSLARKIATSARKLRPSEFTQNASALYLMTRYGFSPTVKDIFNTLEGLQTKLGQVIETTRSSESLDDVSTYSTTYNEAGTFTVLGNVTSTKKVTARCMALDRYTKTRFDALGLGFKNFATVGWELIPFSFVVDWFVNVGDLIGSLIPNFGLEQIGTTTAVILSREDVWESTSITLNSPGTFSVITAPSKSTCKRIYSTYDRSLGIPTPKMYAKTDFRFDNLTRALDASALLVQQLRK